MAQIVRFYLYCGDKVVLGCFFDLKLESLAGGVWKSSDSYGFVRFGQNPYNSIANCREKKRTL